METIKKSHSKSQKISELQRSFHSIDVGCPGYYPYRDGLLFDQDERGNGRCPFIILKVTKDYTKISRGLLLRASEKKTFYFKDYDHYDDLTDEIGQILRSYFKSMKCKWYRTK